MRRLIGAVMGWRVVWLQGHDGEVVKRLAHPTPFGYYAYWFSRLGRIGGVLLQDDGTTKGASYVHYWKSDFQRATSGEGDSR